MKSLLGCLIIFLFSQKGITQSIEKQTIAISYDSNIDTITKFKILKIDSIQSVYIIYARRKDSIMKIVSKMDISNDCMSLIKGKFYDLELESLLQYVSSKRHIGGVKYNGLLIKLEGGNVTWDLFTCDQLRGLCYNNLNPFTYK